MTSHLADKESRVSERLRLLAVCYHFPPVGSAGTGRAVRLLPGLFELGIEPTVLTIDPDDWSSVRFTVDHSRSGRVAGIPTIRVKDTGVRYFAADRWPAIHKYFWFAGYPALLDYASAWSARIRRRSRDIVRRSRPDVIYVSAPPFSSIAAAAALAERAGAALVIDYRDPWTTASLAAHPSRAHFLWERKMELKTLRRADRIILNTLEARDLLIELDGRFAPISAVIPNGAVQYKAHLAIDTHRSSHDGVFRLLFAGTLYEDRQVQSKLGQFRPEPVDEGARSLRPLLGAMSLLGSASPEVLKRLVVQVVGIVPDGQLHAIHRSGFRDRFEMVGNVPHSKSLGLIAKSDALYLNQVAWVDRSRGMPHVPGKTFEYLASGRPILAPLGPGATRRVLSGRRDVVVCGLDDPSSIAEGLEELMSSVGSRPSAITNVDSPCVDVRALATEIRAAVGRRDRRPTAGGSQVGWSNS